MSITTFAELIASPDSEKVFLVEVAPNQPIYEWTQHAGDVYYYEVGTRQVDRVTEDGTPLTEAASIAAMSAVLL